MAAGVLDCDDGNHSSFMRYINCINYTESNRDRERERERESERERERGRETANALHNFSTSFVH